MNSAHCADALPRRLGLGPIHPLSPQRTPIQGREIRSRPHLIQGNDLLGLQRGELLGVGRPLLLDMFLLLLWVVEGLFFRVTFNRLSARSIEELLTARPTLPSYREATRLL